MAPTTLSQNPRNAYRFNTVGIPIVTCWILCVEYIFVHMQTGKSRIGHFLIHFITFSDNMVLNLIALSYNMVLNSLSQMMIYID